MSDIQCLTHERYLLEVHMYVKINLRVAVSGTRDKRIQQYRYQSMRNSGIISTLRSLLDLTTLMFLMVPKCNHWPEQISLRMRLAQPSAEIIWETHVTTNSHECRFQKSKPEMGTYLSAPYAEANLCQFIVDERFQIETFTEFKIFLCFPKSIRRILQERWHAT